MPRLRARSLWLPEPYTIFLFLFEEIRVWCQRLREYIFFPEISFLPRFTPISCQSVAPAYRASRPRFQGMSSVRGLKSISLPPAGCSPPILTGTPLCQVLSYAFTIFLHQTQRSPHSLFLIGFLNGRPPNLLAS